MGTAFKATIVDNAQQRAEGAEILAALPLVLGQPDAEGVAYVHDRCGGGVVDRRTQPDRLLALTRALAHGSRVGLKLVINRF